MFGRANVTHGLSCTTDGCERDQKRGVKGEFNLVGAVPRRDTREKRRSVYPQVVLEESQLGVQKRGGKRAIYVSPLAQRPIRVQHSVVLWPT